MTELDPNGQSSERISHFEKIVKNSPDIFFIYDPHTARVIYGNNRVTPVLGFSMRYHRWQPAGEATSVKKVWMRCGLAMKPAFRIYLVGLRAALSALLVNPFTGNRHEPTRFFRQARSHHPGD